MLLGIKRETECCYNCKHFWKHYIRDERIRRYEEIAHGHCVHPRMKYRCVWDLCDKFEQAAIPGRMEDEIKNQAGQP